MSNRPEDIEASQPYAKREAKQDVYNPASPLQYLLFFFYLDYTCPIAYRYYI